MRALRWRTAYEGDVPARGLFGGLFFGAAGNRAGGQDPHAPEPRADHVAAAIWARNDAFEAGARDPSDAATLAAASEDDPGPISMASPRARASRATLLVLGGAGASGACFDDAHALDIATGRWTVLRLDAYTRASEILNPGPGPRAGHASCVFLGRYLCVVGGGNDTANEHTEASVLDLRSMAWLGPPRAFAAPPGAGEGLSLCALETATRAGGDACLVAFGGYDGSCRNETHAFRVPSAFLDDDATREDARENGEGARGGAEAARTAPAVGARRSLFGRFLDPGPAAPEPVDPAPAAPDPADAPSAGADEAPSRVDALARDNLRLRQENARLVEEASRAARLSAAMRARAEASESRAAEADAALADARRAVAALEAAARASSDGESALAARLEASRKKAAEPRGAKAGVVGEDARDESDEEDPESRRGWLFGL